MNWIPWESQIIMAKDGYKVINKYRLVYLAGEERTGKLLASVLIAEMCKTIDTVLVLTTAKAKDGWIEAFDNYEPIKDFSLSTYHQAHKQAPHDLVILDECHNYLSTYPKPGVFWRRVKKLCIKKPIIYCSATPHPQGYQQLYHQFALSSFSPWKSYKNFYDWFREYGIPETIYVGGGQEANSYDKTQSERIKKEVAKFFITKTRQASGFEHEPEDKVHYIELSEATKNTYNILLKNGYYEFLDGDEIVADTVGGLRANLHQLEGGGCKIVHIKNKKKVSEPKILPNQEKIDYIKEHWGDTNKIGIMYQYHSEGLKLREHFKHAEIYQGDSYAEGVDLSHLEHLIIYSQSFRTSKHSQRRARQANKKRDTPIIVHYLLVEGAISEDVYVTVSINKKDYIDTVFERIT